MFEITGIVSLIGDTQTFGKGFTKREFVIDVRDGDNQEKVKFECHKDDVSLLDLLGTGDLIRAQFRITGREWNGKYYNNLVCFGIDCQAVPEGRSTPQPQESQEMVEEEVPF